MELNEALADVNKEIDKLEKEITELNKEIKEVKKDFHLSLEQRDARKRWGTNLHRKYAITKDGITTTYFGESLQNIILAKLRKLVYKRTELRKDLKYEQKTISNYLYYY